MTPKEYDGFYWLPHGDDENAIEFRFFKFNDEKGKAEPVGSTQIGDTYHIAFFKSGENGAPVFDESYEAIFADPKIYVQGLAGSGLYGCVLRKTEMSGEWFQDYLSGLAPDVIIKKLKAYAKALANTK